MFFIIRGKPLKCGLALSQYFGLWKNLYGQIFEEIMLPFAE